MTGPAIALFGGLFDPVHEGHTALARHALDRLRLDKLYVIPCGHPPHKPPARLDGANRLTLLQAVFASWPRVVVSDLELSRPGPSFAIDTIREIARLEKTRPLFLMGADNLGELEGWKMPDRILEAARVIAVTRPGGADLTAFPQYTGKIEFLPMPGIAISSTKVRERLASGLDASGLVPAPALSLILKNGWYGAPKP